MNAINRYLIKIRFGLHKIVLSIQRAPDLHGFGTAKRTRDNGLGRSSSQR